MSLTFCFTRIEGPIDCWTCGTTIPAELDECPVCAELPLVDICFDQESDDAETTLD